MRNVERTQFCLNLRCSVAKFVLLQFTLFCREISSVAIYAHFVEKNEPKFVSVEKKGQIRGMRKYICCELWDKNAHNSNCVFGISASKLSVSQVFGAHTCTIYRHLPTKIENKDLFSFWREKIKTMASPSLGALDLLRGVCARNAIASKIVKSNLNLRGLSGPSVLSMIIFHDTYIYYLPALR